MLTVSIWHPSRKSHKRRIGWSLDLRPGRGGQIKGRISVDKEKRLSSGASVPNLGAVKRTPIMLDAALSYLKRGWCVIPVKSDKKPYLRSWQEYQGRKPTEKEIHEWLAKALVNAAACYGKANKLEKMDHCLEKLIKLLEEQID